MRVNNRNSYRVDMDVYLEPEGPFTLTAGASIGWAVAAGVGAAFLYGIGINLVRRHLTGLPPAAVASPT